MPLITINQMQKYYGDNHVLKGVDLDIEMGEVISIIGRSGSGKSTLLRCINGLEGYQDGSIKLGGMTITDRDSQAREISRSVGMVFQNFNLFPHMTALRLPARWRCRQRCYCVTRLPRRWILNWWVKCSRFLSSWLLRE